MRIRIIIWSMPSCLALEAPPCRRPLAHQPHEAARRQTRVQEEQERTHGRQGQVGREILEQERNSDSWTRLEKEEGGKRAREKEIECWR